MIPKTKDTTKQKIIVGDTFNDASQFVIGNGEVIREIVSISQPKIPGGCLAKRGSK